MKVKQVAGKNNNLQKDFYVQTKFYRWAELLTIGNRKSNVEM